MAAREDTKTSVRTSSRQHGRGNSRRKNSNSIVAQYSLSPYSSSRDYNPIQADLEYK